MGDLHTILLEGLGHIRGGKLHIEGNEVAGCLGPFVGGDVHLAVHFLPPIPPDPNRWGGGCCLWEPGPCPAGHREHPDRILNVALRGVLRNDGARWWVDTFDGRSVDVPFDLLDGHYGRVAVATVLSVQAMEEVVSNHDLDQIGVRAQDLRDLLNRMQR